MTMKQVKKPVEQWYYSREEWDRLGCGPLPDERNRKKFLEAFVKENPKINGKAIKGNN